MLSTIVLAVLLSGLLIGSAVLWALFLRLGLRWARVPDVTTRRVLFATAIVFILDIFATAFFRAVLPSSDAPAIVFGLVELAAVVIIPCLLIQKLFRAPLHRALQAWLPTLLGSVIAIGFTSLVFHPFV